MKKFINNLNKKYNNKFKYVGDGSFLIKGYSPDAYSKELNTIVLFNGDYYHCNPRVYEATYYNKMLKKVAQEIWDKDRKITEIFKLEGYKVIIIWEKDLKMLELT